MRNSTQTIQEKKAQDKASREQLKQVLIGFTESDYESNATSSQSAREQEKIKLLNGSEISIADIKRIKREIANEVQPYKSIFPPKYYADMFRLLKLAVPAEGMRRRPHIMAVYTNAIIYQRFPKEVLPMLQERNPYISMGLRLHKHHQLLTAEGRLRLKGYINDALEVMGRCNTWTEFVAQYCTKYGLPYQVKMDL